MASMAPGAAVVVPSDSPGALAAAMHDVLSGLIETESLVERGAERAELHRTEAVVAGHLALYRELRGGVS